MCVYARRAVARAPHQGRGAGLPSPRPSVLRWRDRSARTRQRASGGASSFASCCAQHSGDAGTLPPYSPECLEKLSEKSRTRLQRSPPGRRRATFRSISPPVYRSNPRSERCSTPFLDSLRRCVLRTSHVRSFPKFAPSDRVLLPLRLLPLPESRVLVQTAREAKGDLYMSVGSGR